MVLQAAAETNTAPNQLRVAVVQMAVGRSLAENRDHIISGIAKAAVLGVRVVVLPESALRAERHDQPAAVDEAVAAIRRTARERKVYVLFGGASYLHKAAREVNWMYVIGPDGQDVSYYDKLYDQHRAKMPGVFQIDGIPCSAFLCADRWLRGAEEIPIQQGAQISFELSCNFSNEWVEPYEWYWYVPRALRNNVWVIFANTGNKATGVSVTGDPQDLRHGHSAVIAPDGRIAAAARDDAEAIIVADVEVSRATRVEALARASHPALREFWAAGLKGQMGQAIEAPPVVALTSPETEITLAVAQVTDNVTAIETMIGQAAAKDADLVAFPARAIAEGALDRIRAVAGKDKITVVVGAEHHAEGDRRNSAYVIGPDGSVLARYDQLSATHPFQRGTDPRAMWFRVKGVPAVVMIGRDALWTELAELAAVAGAQILVHIDHDDASGPEAELRRLQIWSNLASFRTFTANANVVGSAIWDDVRDVPRTKASTVEVDSPYSADLIVRAGGGPQLITPTRRFGRLNTYHPRWTSHINPQMDAWYRLGASLIGPAPSSTSGEGRPYVNGQFKGHIAYSADGNHNDPDDWIASPMALAILAESGVKDRLVHFDYNCILPLTNPDWEKIHAESVLGAAERYGFDKSLFQDCRKHLDRAVQSITKAINDSSAESPLYFIIAGPMEVPYLGIQKSDPAKRKFVYCISHSRWNDGFASQYKFTFTKRSVIEQDVHWVQIRDQNPRLSLSPYGRPATPEQFADFFWLRDSSDPTLKFLWERMQVSTRPDPSDAGMAWFLVTGDEECDPLKLKRLIVDHKPMVLVSARKQVRIEAENFRHLDGFAVEDRRDKSASHQLGIKLTGGTNGTIRTSFDDPFVKRNGRYDVAIRYLDEKDVLARFAVLVNNIPRGEAWQSAGEGHGWTNHTIHDLEIRVGDEIRLDARGLAVRLDYLQLDSSDFEGR